MRLRCGFAPSPAVVGEGGDGGVNPERDIGWTSPPSLPPLPGEGVIGDSQLTRNKNYPRCASRINALMIKKWNYAAISMYSTLLEGGGMSIPSSRIPSI